MKGWSRPQVDFIPANPDFVDGVGSGYFADEDESLFTPSRRPTSEAWRDERGSRFQPMLKLPKQSLPDVLRLVSERGRVCPLPEAWRFIRQFIAARGDLWRIPDVVGEWKWNQVSVVHKRLLVFEQLLHANSTAAFKSSRSHLHCLTEDDRQHESWKCQTRWVSTSHSSRSGSACSSFTTIPWGPRGRASCAPYVDSAL